MSDRARARRLGATADEPFTVFVDGEPVPACPGETIAVAMLAAGQRAIRRTAKRAEARGLYCVMGVCWECVVLVDGRAVRACVTPATPGLSVERPGRHS